MKTLTKQFIFILFSSLCLTLAGCGGDEDDDPATKKDDDPGTKTETLSVDARPTDWLRTDADLDPFVSLSLTIASPDLSQYAVPADSGSWEDDLMATFVNGTCRGVSGPFQEGTVDGSTTENIIFMPAVAGFTTDDADVAKTVTIKYYSARLHHIFTATSPYPLKNGIEAYGTRSNPLVITWNK